MITRSFANGFEVSDWTQELVTVPNQWGTIGSLGLFEEVGVAENTVTLEEINKDGALISDQNRGVRATVGKDYSRKLRTWPVPHFPYDDAIMPQDVQGRRAYGQPNSEETVAAVRARKLERIRQNHAWTLEYARAKAITSGDVYAPNGTVSLNWFTEFGVTQQTVPFIMGTTTTEVLGKVEAVIAYIQDNIQNGGVLTGVIGLCSPTFFAALITHPTVKTAYQYYTSTQQPLRERLATGYNINMHREFDYGGIHFIEMRDQYAGNPLIPVGEAYFVPTGTDVFKTHFGPANKFDFVNTVGEQAYFFEYPSIKGDQITIETESNFLNTVRRPQVCVRATL